MKQADIPMWEQKIVMIQKDYPEVHLFYSTNEGWAFVSWKGKRERVDPSMTVDEIRNIITSIKR